MKRESDCGDEGFPFTPLIIVGAGRSGTNALRDALTRLPGFATWPCDEINPIWRHGNQNWPDDEIPPEQATPSVRESIRNAFRRIWRQQGCPDFVVEKTCANALRVAFVAAILPEARYIHMVRNGFDVVASAIKRWRGELELPGLAYYLAKARYAPVSDLPNYAFSTLRNIVGIKLRHQEHFKSWGPRFAGINDFVGTVTIDELAARQWAACVSLSDSAFLQMSPDLVYPLRYEEFTQNPRCKLMQIMQWLAILRDEADLKYAASLIRASSVGKGQPVANALSTKIKDLLEPPMRAHGYPN